MYNGEDGDMSISQLSERESTKGIHKGCLTVESINIEKRKRALKAANAVSKVEGTSSSKQAEQIFRQWREGKLTNEQMKAKILALHNNTNKRQ